MSSSFVSFHVQQLLFSLVTDNETNRDSLILVLPSRSHMGFRNSKPKMQHSGTLLQEGVKRTQIVVSGKNTVSRNVKNHDNFCVGLADTF